MYEANLEVALLQMEDKFGRWASNASGGENVSRDPWVSLPGVFDGRRRVREHPAATGTVAIAGGPPQAPDKTVSVLAASSAHRGTR